MHRSGPDSFIRWPERYVICNSLLPLFCCLEAIEEKESGRSDEDDRNQSIDFLLGIGVLGLGGFAAKAACH